ncbi:MAG: type II secretion system protein [Planctomycetota bacterium]
MMHPRSAFTLIEILVAMAIFMSLMLIGSMAFSRFGTVGEDALTAIALHGRAEALMRVLDEHVATAPASTALWLDNNEEAGDPVGRLVSMYTFKMQEDMEFAIEQDVRNRTGIEPWGDLLHHDLAWSLFEWRRDGHLRHAVSRTPMKPGDVDSFEDWAKWQKRVPANMPLSHMRPTPQRDIVHLVGRVSGTPQRVGPLYLAVEQTVRDTSMPLSGFGDPQVYLDRGWPLYMHRIGWFGNKTPIDGSFGVINPDERSYNRDWMNLIGLGLDHEHYPDQRRIAFSGLECFELRPLDASGDLITAEDDSLGDGSGGGSLDWRGLPPGGTDTGARVVARPAALHMRCLLHNVPDATIDDQDADGDGDTDEPLSDALRERVWNDPGLGTIAERRRAFAELLYDNGHMSLLVDHRIPLR